MPNDFLLFKELQIPAIQIEYQPKFQITFND